MRYLLDTCLVAELFKAVPNAGVSKWLASRSETDCFLSAITIGELQAGLTLPTAKARGFLFHWSRHC